MQANMVDMQIPDKVQGIPYGGMGGCDTFHSARIPRQEEEKKMKAYDCCVAAAQTTL